ncbi:glutamate receptor ionotropic, kainate 3-like isoform X1 [Pomacea canaliculata]|uniref:glutamate receptor ionotropic, kainate 3-like isoform X1 n=1 Tax=Pomacea canaliculata TaxID=400727 RepID=UPI000D727FB9|nr:glutamate receptor ionotropic, kainate 3-like isoform X1 [Pomacea canaliculata]
MRQNGVVGATGQLSFDSQGKRSNFTLNITAIGGAEYNTIGEWVSRVEIFDTRLRLNAQNNGNRSTPFPLKGRVAKVVMIEERPFTMLKRDHISRKGNDRFQGFAVDLIDEIARMLDFEYEIYLVHDGNFGSKKSNGEWNGMIGELLAGNATMSVAPLSINSDREEAVDFTKPFMTRYISVLMRLPRRETSYFEFLNPLSPIVWICTMCSFVVVSIVLYMLERIGTAPARADGPLQQRAPQITIREAFWFIFGSLLQGNTDSSPSTIPGRILTSAWWFFALILISSYTANLAAFLTVKKINTPIKSVTDLAQQNKIKYGTVKSSGVMSFFKNTKIEHFAKMWAQMSEIEPDSMVDNTSVGFMQVKEQDYAFFWDTTVNKYHTIVDCDLMEIGPPFDPKGFGIGVPPGATYREELSMAILKLSDRGRLHELETRYWGNRNCPDLSKPSSDETSELQIENVAGVFFILVGGIIIAAVVCLGEYVGHALLRASKLETKGPENGYGTGEAFL